MPIFLLSFTTTIFYNYLAYPVVSSYSGMHVFSACLSHLDIILAELGENELNDVANVRIKASYV